MPRAHLDARRARILEGLDRTAEPVGSATDSLSREQIDHLVREAEELYWNELAWEELTDEERVVGGHLTELVFPGLLAFVDGLLLESLPRAEFGTARPHPEVVEEILLFLAERYWEATAELEQGADSGSLVWARAMTAHLIDLVLYPLYRLSPAEREELEGRA
ncbi:MAG: hypothetical protein GEU90_05840 [Gemmatimonas sp.]|nr:hypothetical protein [Gemmatimonas sp.]